MEDPCDFLLFFGVFISILCKFFEYCICGLYLLSRFRESIILQCIRIRNNLWMYLPSLFWLFGCLYAIMNLNRIIKKLKAIIMLCILLVSSVSVAILVSLWNFRNKYFAWRTNIIRYAFTFFVWSFVMPAGEVISEKYVLEYGTDCLEMHVGAVQPEERVIVIDDLVATGGTLCAAIRLLGMSSVTPY